MENGNLKKLSGEELENIRGGASIWYKVGKWFGRLLDGGGCGGGPDYIYDYDGFELQGVSLSHS